VLEAGCGTGNVLRVLEAECGSEAVTGMDLFEEGLRFARQRTRCRLVLGDIHQPPFDFQFDLIGMFDVLEHLDNDIQVLRDLNRLLLTGRYLMLTVPAHMSLWSYFDAASCHRRRYALGELQQKLLSTGFAVDFISEFMTALFPILWIGRRLRRTAPTGDGNRHLAERELRIIPVFNGLMARFLSWEAVWLARRRRLPFGTSVLALARKVRDVQ